MLKLIMKLVLKYVADQFFIDVNCFYRGGHFSINATRDIGEVSDIMYNHPLKVVRSILSTQAAALDIHRNLYDMLRTTDDNEGNYQTIEQRSDEITEYFQIMRERVLSAEALQKSKSLKNFGCLAG